MMALLKNIQEIIPKRISTLTDVKVFIWNSPFRRNIHTTMSKRGSKCDDVPDQLPCKGSTEPIQNKVALVTGGSSGMGLSFCKELLRYGAKGVMIADLDECIGKKVIYNLCCEFGKGKVAFIRTDVANWRQLKNAFNCCKSTFHGLDIVINNAAVLDEKCWMKQVDINCIGVTRGTMLGLDLMGKDCGGKGGTIINVSSILTFYKCSACPVHVATKHYVMGLSSSYGHPNRFKTTGVRIMTLCPGITVTPMFCNLDEKLADADQVEIMQEELCALPVQQPKCVAQSLICMILHGATGSVWVSEAAEPPYEIAIPGPAPSKGAESVAKKQ